MHVHLGCPAKCKVSACHSPGKEQLQRHKYTCHCYMHSSQHGGGAAESCAYLTCADDDVQKKEGVRFMPLAGRHTAAAVCQIVRGRQSTSACSSTEETEITAEMSQCPATLYLAHELSPKEVALLQGKPSFSHSRPICSSMLSKVVFSFLLLCHHPHLTTLSCAAQHHMHIFMWLTTAVCTKASRVTY